MALTANQILALNAFSRAQPELIAFGTVHGSGRSSLLYGEDIDLGTILNNLETGGDVILAGDVAGAASSNQVTGLLGAALPTSAANGFLKRNSANTAWEEVIYGTGSNTVAQGNDSRFTDARAPQLSSTTLVATGTTQGTAAAITTQYIYIDAASGSDAGVKLPAATGTGKMYVVFNNAPGVSIKVYPNTGDAIGRSGSANAAVSISYYGCLVCFDRAAGFWDCTSSPVKVGGANGIIWAEQVFSLYGDMALQNGALSVAGKTTLSGNVQTAMPTASPSGTTATVDWNTGISQVVNLASTTGTTTATLTNPVIGGRYLLKVIGKTGRAMTLSPSPKTASGSPITFTATDAAIDVVSLLWDGTSYLVTSLVQNLS